MTSDDRPPTPAGRATPDRPAPIWPRFGLRTLLALPVLAAALIVASMAVDRWTAVPWAGLTQGEPVILKVRDATTGQPVVGARVRWMVSGGTRIDMKTSTPGQIRHFGGSLQGGGYRSLVRDTRHVDLGDSTLMVTADGYEDFAASAAETPLLARPAPDEQSVEYVIRLRRIEEQAP